MSKFKIEKFINAPRKTVWEKLADIGSIHTFHPMVEMSVLTGEKKQGLGAERVCTFYNNGGRVHEEVTAWSEGKSISITMKDGTMPVETAVLQFDLADEGAGTIIKLTGNFKMKGGVLGKIMGPIMMKPMFIKIMNNVFTGLEKHIETGKYIGYKGKIENAVI